MTHKILVVDDEEDILEMIALRLGKEGFDVVTAPSGEEALGRVADSTPDLVVLDVMMPGLNGLDVCERIRGRSDGPQPPVIFLTAKGEDFDHLQGMVRGADAYLVKPVEMTALVGEINRILA